jgi:hypothetical protein
MPLTGYVIRCCAKDCSNEAVYKIASRWSDGLTGELKTYSLCCDACLAKQFESSRTKQAACRLAPGETLEPPGIYRITHGQRDRELERLAELEQSLNQSFNSTQTTAELPRT